MRRGGVRLIKRLMLVLILRFGKPGGSVGIAMAVRPFSSGLGSLAAPGATYSGELRVIYLSQCRPAVPRRVK